MLDKKQCVAMLLAGSQGSRLGILTANMAKPAIPYGGKYRIIDFPLSNCQQRRGRGGRADPVPAPQAQPTSAAAARLGPGPGAWRRICSAPYVKGKSGEWYSGTANAITEPGLYRAVQHRLCAHSQRRPYLQDGLHNAMLQFHIDNKADCTIAVRESALGGSQPFSAS